MAEAAQNVLKGSSIASVLVKAPYSPESNLRPAEGVEKFYDHIIPLASMNASDFSPELVLSELAKWGPIVGVEPGNDEFVPHARRLEEALARRAGKVLPKRTDPNDKFQMAQALAQGGLDHIRGRLVSSTSEVLQFIHEYQLRPHPQGKHSYLVIKPNKSSGGHGFTPLFGQKGQISFEEIDGVIQKLKSLREDDGSPIQSFLVQEALRGPEYPINMMASKNKRTGEVHRVNYFSWKYQKDSRTKIYDYDQSITDLSSPRMQEILQYSQKVAKLFEIDEGAAHMEIFYVPGRGPVLVDLGLRLPGSSQPRLESLALGGISVPEALVWSRLDFDRFVALFPKTQMPAQLHATVITLANRGTQEAVLREDALKIFEEKVRSLPSFQNGFFDRNPGETVEVATSLFKGCYGQVELAHADYRVLVRDRDFVRKELQFLRARD